MKKIIYYTALVSLLFAAVSCKSTKAPVAATEEGKTEAAAPAEGDTENAEGTASAAASTSTKDPDADFTGWIKSKKNINERYGKIQIKIKSGRGSFTIAALNENDKPIPVLSSANEYVTNAFYLKTSKKTYNLVTDSNIRSAARRTTDGAALMYDIPSVAQVTLNFSCFASDKKKDIDMIKVTASIRNTSDRNEEYTLKAVLDTVLGEAAAYHFYTYEDIPIKSEVLYRTLQNQKWFSSKNVNAAMQLFFTGADCTTPELVAFANYSTLEKNSWEPDMLSYRVFDTVLSYNNSAVCTIWKPIKIAPSESGKVVFYLALSGNGTPATGEKYIYSKEFKTAEETGETTTSGLKFITAEPEKEAEGVIAAEVTEIPLEKPAVQEAVTPAEIPTVDFYIKNMTKEHLTPEYIQSLIDRISALEEDSPSLNRQELLQLNAELDAILTYLRQ